jgi:hypothetical protein
MKYTCVIQFKLYLPMQDLHELIKSQHINYAGRPPISSIFNSMIMLFLSKLNLLQYNRKCSEHSFLYPHEQEALGTNFMKYTCVIQFKLYLPMQDLHELIKSQHINYV